MNTSSAPPLRPPPLIRGDNRRCSAAISRTGLSDKTSRLSLTSDDIDGRHQQEQEGKERAKVLDGAFFEEYAILDLKQEGSIRKVKNEAKEQAENLIRKQAADSEYFTLFAKDALNNEQAKLLYSEITFVICHQLGKRKIGGDAISDGDFYVYAQQVFRISEEEHRQLFNEVKARKPPLRYLNVTIVEGRDLEAKDANGLSDPYCMVSIINDEEGNKFSRDRKRVKKRVLRDLREEGEVKMTKIKFNTLRPVWHESFQFKVSDIQHELLRVDLWDHDDQSVFLDEDNRITSIKGFSGFGRYLKQAAQSSKCDRKTLDDFLGIVEMPTKDILATGVDAWYSLLPRSHRSTVQGKLHLKASLIGEQTEIKISDSALSSPSKILRQLWKQFLRYEYTKFNQSKQQDASIWNMELPEIAHLLLIQFAIQNGISEYQSEIIKWQVLSRCFLDVAIPLDFLLDLLDVLKVKPRVEEVDVEEEKEYVASLDEFVKYSMELVKRVRHVFPASVQDQCIRLGKLLLCLISVFKLPLFKAYYPQRWLTGELEEQIEEGTKKWFRIVVAYNQPIQADDVNVMDGLVNLTNAVNVDISEAKEKYDRLLKPTGVCYFNLVYSKLEPLLVGEVKPLLKRISEHIEHGKMQQDFGTALFKLYLALRDFSIYKKLIPNDELVVDDGIDDYGDWFRIAVIKWLDLAKRKAIQRITKAVQIDKVLSVHSMLKYSASAVDTTCCLGQLVVFWNKLQWPNINGSFVFMVQLTDIIGSSAKKYAEIVLEQVQKAGYYDQDEEFDVTEKLCLMMNNLEHVLHFLDTIPEELKYEQLLTELIPVHGADCIKNLNETLTTIIQDAKDEMKQKLDTLLVRTGERMREEIKKYLRSICDSTTKENDPFQATDLLLTYIDNNLVTLKDSLLQQAFKRVLIHIWEVFLFGMEDVVKEMDKKDPQIFQRLYGTLMIAKDFFYADGEGISKDLSLSHTLVALENMLMLYKAPTEVVVQRYYMEKCQEQDKADEQFGLITFKTFYSQTNRALHVEVLNCRNLPPLDNNCKSDPYVEVKLFPPHLFPEQNKRKTSVQEKTLFPLFDENFSFEIPSALCFQEGAIVLLTVKDHDKFQEDDIAGEVFLDMNSILGLDKDIGGGFASIPQTDMPLIHGSLVGQSFKVLEERRDPIAVDFVQKRKTKFRKMAEGKQKSLRIQQQK